jgi:hypothetical protein
MHQVLNCGTLGSIGDLGRIARALSDNGYNIEAIGGGEALLDDSSGIVTLLVTPDDNADVETLDTFLPGLELDSGRSLRSFRVHPDLHVELDDVPGELARAAEALGGANINIMSVLSIDAHAGWAIVCLGFEGDDDKDNAEGILRGEGFTVLPKHGGEKRRKHVDRELRGRIKKGDPDDDDHSDRDPD